MLLTIIAFLIAIFILVVVHEYGHYKMALLCGVKVERFSVGFGPVLWRWKPKNSDTEYVLSALPLGGYVKMADEREGEVAPVDLPRAFNRQSLKKKAAIVAAGPICNLVLAVAIYSVVAWVGQTEVQAVIATPPSQSLVEKAGFLAKDKIIGVMTEEQVAAQKLNPNSTDYKAVQSFSDFAWILTQSGLDKKDVYLLVERPNQPSPIVLELPLSSLQYEEMGKAFLYEIGLVGPYFEPVIAQVIPNGTAHAAGLEVGDKVIKIGELEINDTASLMRWVKEQNTAEAEKKVEIWTVLRQNKPEEIAVQVKTELVDGQRVGKIGVAFEMNAATVLVKAGFIDGISGAFIRTYEMSVLMLRTIGRMLIGEASIKNLSGPISIAEYAGKTASYGLVSYLIFLGVVSVSLGVLNLLPLPVLDGGHLMYYLWEGITKRPVSEQVNIWLQKLGLVIVLMMMVVGVYNDITRHL